LHVSWQNYEYGIHAQEYCISICPYHSTPSAHASNTGDRHRSHRVDGTQEISLRRTGRRVSTIGDSGHDTIPVRSASSHIPQSNRRAQTHREPIFRPARSLAFLRFGVTENGLKLAHWNHSGHLEKPNLLRDLWLQSTPALWRAS